MKKPNWTILILSRLGVVFIVANGFVVVRPVSLLMLVTEKVEMMLQPEQVRIAFEGQLSARCWRRTGATKRSRSRAAARRRQLGLSRRAGSVFASRQ